MGKLSEEGLAELQDPQTWDDEEDAVRPAVKSPRAIVSVAFSREDFEVLVAHAKQHGMKTSEFIRRAALERMSPKQQPVAVSVTGAVYTRYPAVAPPRPKIEVRMPEPPVRATG